MKFTKNQRAELDILLWFADRTEFSESSIKKFFDYSDKGIGRDDAERALLQPKDFEPDFVTLLLAKRNRDLQINEWKLDWGGMTNAWSFIDEPRYIAEWVAKVLDREAIILAWHENKVNENRRAVYKYKKQIEDKPFNRYMGISRS